jgi:DNA-binding MarR family transcriptional regulator
MISLPGKPFLLVVFYAKGNLHPNKKMKSKLPIGYFLKKVDNLLTEGINHIHKEFDINRTQWQILNAIHENIEIGRQQIVGTLSEFVNDEVINSAITNLINRGLINEDSNLKLTEKGAITFKNCLQKQKDFRLKAMNNISEQEYLQTITTLEKIIDNLKMSE